MTIANCRFPPMVKPEQDLLSDDGDDSILRLFADFNSLYPFYPLVGFSFFNTRHQLHTRPIIYQYHSAMPEITIFGSFQRTDVHPYVLPLIQSIKKEEGLTGKLLPMLVATWAPKLKCM
jgi:hypothetical protein